MGSLLKDRKIGLALSSGAARGLAHIGVLEMLEEEEIHIDMLAGTSMGALIGAVYAERQDIDRMKHLAIELGLKRFSFLADPVLPKYGLIRGRKIGNMLRSIIGDVEFGDLKIPFACSAVDINSNQEVVIKQGKVREGVRASCSIPILLTPSKLEGRYLVDGGLLDPVPVKILKDMGADPIIAVNVIPNGQNTFLGASQNNRRKNGPNILSIAIQTVNIISSQRLKSSLSGADVIIEPQVTHISWGDFHRAEECIVQGRLAAQVSIPEIKRLLAG
ncbi:NTE family protein [Dehalogenimonas formicexedens]|uniref:NTE family protein n=1 Tax=Dehalogenimonas formicexedens TaxID=1839801 RepID=A0A1P8F9D5_9CHLR|nr:NTE family protein [Dehalogenimonas formicexedens]